MEHDECIFSKIVRKEIKANIVYENDTVLAFNDINPVAPVHVLVIPKKKYRDFIDFTNNASDAEITQYFKSIKDITYLLNLKNVKFRLITNNGEDSGQTIMYFHTHIIGGKKLQELI